LSAGSTARTIDIARGLADCALNSEAGSLLKTLDSAPLTPGERLGVAEIHARLGAAETAASMVAEVARGDADAPELHEWIGDLFRKTGNAYRAKQAYERALASPRAVNANLVAKLGDCLAELGDKQAALKRYAEATRLDPGYRYPHARAAAVLLTMDGSQGAAAHALALSVAATGNEVHDAIRQAQVMEQNQLLGAAAERIARALESSPQDVGLQIAMARILAKGGRNDDARKRLIDAGAQHPNYPIIWYELARLEAGSGNEPAALAALDRLEATAGPDLSERVRQDPLFQKGGPASALAHRAGAFAGRGGRGSTAPDATQQ
nr:tetratricopeptide repeat protein [Acidobacteriota bacterium]